MLDLREGKILEKFRNTLEKIKKEGRKNKKKVINHYKTNI